MKVISLNSNFPSKDVLELAENIGGEFMIMKRS